MKCAICLSVRDESEVEEAITVVNGHAVCHHHHRRAVMGHLQDFREIIASVYAWEKGL